MPKPVEDLELAAKRGAVLSIANEAKKSHLPWDIFKKFLLIAIGKQAELVDRQVLSNGDNVDAVQKLERLAANLTFGNNVKAAIDEYLKED